MPNSLVIYLIKGAEGETSHSENGITRDYADADIPSDLLKLVVPKVGVLK